MKNKNWYYEMHKLGFNYRMNEMQSALGLSQMKNINKFIKKGKIFLIFIKQILIKTYLIFNISQIIFNLLII